ncbi:MAG: hypothetical protein Q7U04_04785 [Bacteriovorax sp.]|nr:hypothetical protein [Bacteriovorax sp.]
MGLANRKGTMRYKIIYLTLFFLSNLVCSQEIKLENLPYKKNIKENILEGQIFSEANVKSSNLNKDQSLNFSIAGLHSKSCTYVLKTLSLYEEYSNYLSFVKFSQYNEQKQEINFLLSHPLLPYDMVLIFKLPRITAPGTYPFIFDIGILKNLHGTINVINHQDRCLFYSYAQWSGPHTGFPNMVFELFTQVLSKLSMEMLFRISSSLKH